MPSYAIIGASRGIGLELVRQIASRSDTVVFAVVRNAATSSHLAAFVERREIKNVHILQADVVDHVAMRAAADQAAEITGGTLDVLIHGAARMDPKNMFKTLTRYEDDNKLDEDFLQNFKVNALGVAHSVNAFLPLLRRGVSKKIVVITSPAGERRFTWNLRMDIMAAYAASKAATQMILTKYAVALEDEGFTVVSLLPGMVDVSATAVAKPDENAMAELAPLIQKMKNAHPQFDLILSLEEGTRSLLDAIDSLKRSDSGSVQAPGDPNMTELLDH